MKNSYGKWLLALLWVVYVLSFIDRQIVAVLGVPIRTEFDLTNVQIGLLYGTAFSFVYALAGIPMGRLADRWSHRWMISIGLFTWSMVTLLSGFATSFTALVIFRMILGVSQAMLSPAAYAVLANSFPSEQRSFVFSVYASAIFAGIGFSFLGGGTLALHYDWRIAMVTVGIPGLILAPFVWLFIRETDRMEAKSRPFVSETLAHMRYILKKRTVQLHLIGFSALACLGYSVLAFISTILTNVFERPDLIRHYGWFIFGVSGTVLVAGYAADRLAKVSKSRRFYIGIFAALACLPLYGIGLFHADATIALIFLGCAILISSCYNGVGAALIQHFVTTDMRALAGGIYLFTISITGFGLGPPLTGWLMDNLFLGKYAPSMALMTVILGCSIISTLSFYYAMKTYKKDSLDY